ncbi:hypothetical protein Tco_1336569 [Tanacetum coccineum]
MANENVPAPASTRSDDQILPVAAWVPIRKSNYVLDLQKKQKNLIFQISVDIIQNTNFFRAFTASASVPAIYIQQFWNTLTYEAKIRTYSFELDETQFVLDANLLREALEITLIDQTHQFVSPLSGEAIMDFERQTSRYSLLSIHEAYYLSLGRIHNIHQRSASPFHLAEEDLRLGNLKFVSKGEIDEVFGMPIPNELISNNIRNASYYNAYLEMVVKHDQESCPKGKERRNLQYQEPKPKGLLSLEYVSGTGVALLEVWQLRNCCRGLPTILVVEGNGKAINTKEQAWLILPSPALTQRGEHHNQLYPRRTPTTEEASTRPSTQPLDDTYANIIRDSPSSADAETGARSDKTSSGGDTEIVQVTEELGEDVEKQEKVEEKTMELDQDQAGSDPGETLESRPQPEQVYMEEDQAGPDHGISRVALGGPDPEPTHNEFMVDLYPKDAYAIGDQFINDKSTDDEPIKLNVEAEVVFMVTVPIYQASSSVPPLSTPVIDLSPPKPASSTTQTPIFIATTMTTTPLLPPPQQQSTTESELVERVAALEKKLSDLEQTNKNLDNTTRNLGSRVYTLELRDLPHKINEAVCEMSKRRFK